MRSRHAVRGEPDELVLGLERRAAEQPDVPVDPARTTLYSPGDLYDAAPYDDSLDARAYRWARAPRTPEAALCRALHDHAIDVALERWIADRRLVGVMGGHGLRRGEQAYVEAARLGMLLGASHVVATGGGPGAMEAANLGGYLTGRPDALADALARLAAAPSFHPSVDAWAEAAFDVLARHPDGAPGLGIPTWHYGHEPPNVFASAIAKYFRNSQREAILLEICDAGIVFLPGLGGTVQEIFQDACENFYADEAAVAPMVLVGATYWTETLPAWPLLRALARGRAMERHVHLVDTVDEAAQLVDSNDTDTNTVTRTTD
ncbi:Rossmann fold nucleotide-binding protein [Nocardioides soli]|uniref:Putative Rossmann-fold nucleotide-binding protein n=1 Tax=Nocardioides soli TaxID=1036020 RepID=A0A7W4VRM7_9ACTN|nr:putative Rossmann-fold nucleotide-binding protein [Nocardioides soli]